MKQLIGNYLSLYTVIMVLVGCEQIDKEPEIGTGQFQMFADTTGDWPSPELEARALAMDADTITSDTSFFLHNEEYRLVLTGVKTGYKPNDRRFTIRLTNSAEVLSDTALSISAFKDSLDTDFLERAGFYGLHLVSLEADRLLLDAFVGVDESCYMYHMSVALHYRDSLKGRIEYVVVPDDPSHD